MQYYRQQFDAMIAALAHNQYAPPLETARAFKQKRINAVTRALGLTNLFVPVDGFYPSFDPNATFTSYTRPLQRDVIVMGCSVMSYTQNVDNRLIGAFRIRLPAPQEHLSQNYIFPAMGFAPATYSVFFPAPFILKASEQIAIDFGQNAPQAGQELHINFTIDAAKHNQVVLFCATVNNCFDQDEQELLARCVRVVNETDYQKRVLLPSWTHGSQAVTSQTDSPFIGGMDNLIVYNPPGNSTTAIPVGSETTSETRQTDVPLLVTGVSINSIEDIRITDTGTGYSFTQGDFIYAHSLFYPEEFLQSIYRGPYYSYFRLPVPHLLRPGATLFTEHLAGDDIDRLSLEPFNPEYMVWECITP